MGSVRKLFAVSSFMLAAAALAAPTSALAAGGDVLAFQGTTTSLTCATGPVPAVNCPTGVGIAVVGGHGTYNFSTSASSAIPVTCTVEDTDRDGDGGACSITSNGTYTNVVCGTGLASGSATITNNANPSISVSIGYTIVFAAGLGVIEGSAAESDGGSGPVLGVVDIRPEGTGGTSGVCTTGFSVIGVGFTTA
jgi:hypothetical protein